MARRKIRSKIFNKFKLADSYTSLIMGAIVVLAAGILFISLAKGNRNIQTSSISEEPKIGEEKSQNLKTSSIYTINQGDDLWTISEKVYNDGYKWSEIAKENNLENPGLIYEGNKLIIPTAAPTTVQKESVSIIQNNSITENTYIIRAGDNLWDIAVRAYGDGFRWPDIAKANNLENPSLIFSDNVLTIPR